MPRLVVDRRTLKRRLNIDVKVAPSDRRGARYGYWHPASRTVLVSPNQPLVGQHVTLIHEFLHVLDDQMLHHKIIRRRSDHRWIDSAASNLLLMLVLAGMYAGVTKRQMLRFVREHVPERPRKRKRRCRP